MTRRRPSDPQDIQRRRAERIANEREIDRLRERILARVERDPGSGCWLWQGTKTRGYGMISVGGSMHYVHRAMWAVENGPADGQCVCHRCDTPACANPAHLFVGSPADNNADRHAKGRSAGGSLKGESNPGAKLSDAEVTLIRSLRGTLPQARIAERFGVAQSQVCRIQRGRRRAEASQ